MTFKEPPKKDYTKKENLLPARKAIKEHCLGCCGWSRIEVRDCEITSCPLWPYRTGILPKEMRKKTNNLKGGFKKPCDT